MNIYIPKHIKKIGVVDKMCELIDKYSSSNMYVDNTAINSFNDYYYYLKADPVNRFIHFCIPESKWIEEGNTEDYDSVIQYISRMFYSVKGTYQVLEYMKKYLKLDMRDVVYTVRLLRFTIESVTLSDIDEAIYYSALIDFLEALLYFANVDIKINIINLELSNTLRNYIGVHITTYKEYTAVRYDSQE